MLIIVYTRTIRNKEVKKLRRNFVGSIYYSIEFVCLNTTVKYIFLELLFKLIEYLLRIIINNKYNIKYQAKRCRLF